MRKLRHSAFLFFTLTLFLPGCALEEETDDELLFTEGEEMPLVQLGRHVLSVDCLRATSTKILVADIASGRNAMTRCAVVPDSEAASAATSGRSRLFHGASGGSMYGNVQMPWLNFGPEFQHTGGSYSSLRAPVSPDYYYPDFANGGAPDPALVQSFPPSIFLTILFGVPGGGPGASAVSMLYYLLFDIAIPNRVQPSMPGDGYLIPSAGYLIPPGYSQPVDYVDYNMNRRCFDNLAKSSHFGLLANDWGTLVNSGSSLRNHKSCGKRVKFRVQYR